MRTCTSCGRTLGKVATRCLYCGAAAAEAPPAGGGKPVLVRCPGCLRNARGAPGATGTCAYCALWFQVDDDGVARVGRNPSTPAATRAQVDALVADLPSARLWNVVRDILHRRAAYSELGAGEAERAIAALTLIATWPSAAPSWMPLPIADAPTVIPRAVFGVSDGAALQEYGHTVLLVLVGLRDRVADTTGRAAVNLLGLASNAALCVGFGVSEDDQVQTRARVQIRARLVEQHGGVDLEGLANQIDQHRPTPGFSTRRTDVLQAHFKPI